MLRIRGRRCAPAACLRLEATMSAITGIHHITCIAGDPQENVAFYTGVLGMRLVKKSVNQDVPDTYHLFYADGEAHPGADLTFFPWPKLPPVQKGVGLAVEASLAIPARSLEYWADRLATAGAKVGDRSEEHTSELQSQSNLVCRLLLEKKKERKKQEST